MEQSKHIHAIQLLRAVAASMVVVDHSILAIFNATITPAQQNAAWTLGGLGVETFFAISGCLMMLTTSHQFGRAGGALSFMKRRILRIVPLYWLLTTVIIVRLALEQNYLPLSNILQSYFFIPYATGGDLRPIVQVGWTLNYEMLFYVVFAATLLLPRQPGIAALCAVFTVLIGVGAFAKPLWDMSDPSTLFQAWTSPLMLIFLIGALVALLRPWLLTLVRPLSSLVLMMLALAVLVGGFAVTVQLGIVQPFPWQHDWALRGCAVLAVVVCMLPNSQPKSRLTQFFYLLGNASYSTYLFHPFAIRYGLLFLDRYALHPYVVTLLLLAVGNVLGLVIHKLVEVPLLNVFRSKRGLLQVFRAGSRRPRLVQGISVSTRQHGSVD